MNVSEGWFAATAPFARDQCPVDVDPDGLGGVDGDLGDRFGDASECTSRLQMGRYRLFASSRSDDHRQHRYSYICEQRPDCRCRLVCRREPFPDLDGCGRNPLATGQWPDLGERSSGCAGV